MAAADQLQVPPAPPAVSNFFDARPPTANTCELRGRPVPDRSCIFWIFWIFKPVSTDT